MACWWGARLKVCLYSGAPGNLLPAISSAVDIFCYLLTCMVCSHLRATFPSPFTLDGSRVILLETVLAFYVHSHVAMRTALGLDHWLCTLPCTALCCVHSPMLCTLPPAVLLPVYIPVACSLKSPVYSLGTSDFTVLACSNRMVLLREPIGLCPMISLPRSRISSTTFIL